MAHFEQQIEDDSDAEDDKEMFGTLMRCPTTEQEAIDMVHRMEEDASRWAQCDEDSEELDGSDEDTVNIREYEASAKIKE